MIAESKDYLRVAAGSVANFRSSETAAAERCGTGDSVGRVFYTSKVIPWTV